jgi:hypothetical protein
MKQLLFLLFLGLSNVLIAQNSSLRKLPSKHDSLPNVLKNLNLQLKYKSNNGQGFDIYESGLDGMPILMPDKNNKSSLGMSKSNPTEIYKPYRKYQPELVKPNDKLGFKIEIDSLIVTPKKFKNY